MLPPRDKQFVPEKRKSEEEGTASARPRRDTHPPARYGNHVLDLSDDILFPEEVPRSSINMRASEKATRSMPTIPKEAALRGATGLKSSHSDVGIKSDQPKARTIATKYGDIRAAKENEALHQRSLTEAENELKRLLLENGISEAERDLAVILSSIKSFEALKKAQEYCDNVVQERALHQAAHDNLQSKLDFAD